MVKKMFVGWGIKGKPFTREQFKKSYLKKSSKQTYPQYMETIREQKKSPRLRKSFKWTMK